MLLSIDVEYAVLVKLNSSSRLFGHHRVNRPCSTCTGTELQKVLMANSVDASSVDGTWRTAGRVTSTRNLGRTLRHCLEAMQLPEAASRNLGRTLRHCLEAMQLPEAASLAQRVVRAVKKQ
jgi:hypothetical protein